MRTLLRPRAALTMGALAMAVGLSAVPAAHAAFPGSNGRILFTSNLAGGLSELYTVKPDGNERKRLTRNNSGDGEGAYSPSGNKIAFVRGVRRGAEIWTMNANGTGKRRVTQQHLRRRQPGVVAGRTATCVPQHPPDRARRGAQLRHLGDQYRRYRGDSADERPVPG